MTASAYIGSYYENGQYALCVYVIDEEQNVRYRSTNVHPDTQDLQELAGEMRGVCTVVKWMRWLGMRSGIESMEVHIPSQEVYDWCVSEAPPENESMAFLRTFLKTQRNDAISFCLSDAPQLADCRQKAKTALWDAFRKKDEAYIIKDVLQKARALGIPVTPVRKQRQILTNEQVIRELSTLEMAQLLSRQGYGKDTQVLVEWLRKPYDSN